MKVFGLKNLKIQKFFSELCPQFSESRECKLVKELMHAMEVFLF